MRCWGRSTPADAKGLEFEHSQCAMDTRIFVSGWLTTGALTRAPRGLRRPQARDAALRRPLFRQLRQRAVRRHRQPELTAPQCHERYVDRGGLPLRAVLCMSAYKKLTGLYDVSMLVATVDAPRAGVQGRFDAVGVSFDNALKLSAHYLEGFAMDDAARWRRAVKLAVIEVLDRDGSARLSCAGVAMAGHHRPQRSTATSCWTIPTSPARHATLREDDGRPQRPGRRYAQRRPAQGAAARRPRSAPSCCRGDVLQLGATRLRVRRASDLLAPERLLTPEPAAAASRAGADAGARRLARRVALARHRSGRAPHRLPAGAARAAAGARGLERLLGGRLEAGATPVRLRCARTHRVRLLPDRRCRHAAAAARRVFAGMAAAQPNRRHRGERPCCGPWSSRI